MTSTHLCTFDVLSHFPSCVHSASVLLFLSARDFRTSLLPNFAALPQVTRACCLFDRKGHEQKTRVRNFSGSRDFPRGGSFFLSVINYNFAEHLSRCCIYRALLGFLTWWARAHCDLLSCELLRSELGPWHFQRSRPSRHQASLHKPLLVLSLRCDDFRELLG